MSNRSDLFIQKALGDDFYESLVKVELWKPGTKTTLDHEEIRTALQIVPRAVLSLLYQHLSSMKVGESKEFPLMMGPDTHLKADKHERDVYSGHIREGGKILVDYKFRSIPGIGLVVMSCFELYDMENLINHRPEKEEDSSKIQKLIDERIALHNLIEQIVTKKLSERDAIHQLLMAKITEAMQVKPKEPEVIIAVAAPEAPETAVEKKEDLKKGSPLKDFLKKREEKKKPKEFIVHMAKGEQVSCPDCGKNIYDGNLFSGCICLGDDMDRKVWIKKSESGDIKIRFSKGWDQENIEMLLEVMRDRRNGRSK